MPRRWMVRHLALGLVGDRHGLPPRLFGGIASSQVDCRWIHLREVRSVSLSLSPPSCSARPFTSSLGVPSTTGKASMYLAQRPNPMRLEVMPRRFRARSWVRGAMPAQTALLSTSTAGRSPLASSARSQATATSIFFGPDAGVSLESPEALRWGWGIGWWEAVLACLVPPVSCRRPTRPGSPLTGLETGLRGPAAKAALRPSL